MINSIEIGFSPCPNDTFMFFALVNGLVETEGLTFQPFIADVEELNQRVLTNSIAASKASYRAIACSLENYRLLQSGSALGRGCGPLLIAKKSLAVTGHESVLMPGENTTANFLLELFYPQLSHKKAVLFSQIENDLVEGRADFGVIIHENRFTFRDKGLVEIDDLGKRWEVETGLPIPLGGIVVNKKLSEDVQSKINRSIKRSVQYAFDNPQKTMPFVRKYAQNMAEKVMRQHIDLYVNEFSLELGAEGNRAVDELFHRSGNKTGKPYLVSF